MVEQKVLDDLFAAFPDAILNRNLEFIADPHRRVNSYFRLDNCETREDVVEKLLAWISRDAFKSQHFDASWRNAQVHKYHLDGINQFCGTAFTPEEIELGENREHIIEAFARGVYQVLQDNAGRLYDLKEDCHG